VRNGSQLRAGDWVEVRSKAEVLATLDKTGRLEGLPFMPEMFEFCGRRLRVLKRAHKTCDPPNGIDGRRMFRTVHLEDVRCTGDAHGGCEARCLVFWKEAWLNKTGTNAESRVGTSRQWLVNDSRFEPRLACAEEDVVAGVRWSGAKSSSDEPVFICQSTQLSAASFPLPWWDLRQYVEDYTSGNASLSELGASFLLFWYGQLVSAGFGVGSALRWVYDTAQRLRGGTAYPWRFGKIPKGVRTPSATLDLKPGELVRVRSYSEILSTLNEEGRNRGMWFDAEMVPYCGGTYRVLARVSHFINEKTGKMLHVENDCIVLEKVVCRACYARHRRFCPRSIFAYWREIWLERIEPDTTGPPQSNSY
jgi:hypothetical protein